MLKSYGVVWLRVRLLTPRPFLGRNQQYPAVGLSSIDSTLKAIEDAAKANAPPPLPKVSNKFGKDHDFLGDEKPSIPRGRAPAASR